MNVLFVSNDPAIFDEQSSVRARMRLYAKEIGNLHIISPCNLQRNVPHEQHENLENNSSLSLYSVRGKKPFTFLQMQRLARSIIKKENIQIVSAQDPFEYGLIAARAVKGTGAKLHIQIHTDPFSRWFTNVKIVYSTQVRMPFINKIRQRIADRVIPQADGIRVVSERVKNSLTKRYGNRIPEPVVIPLAVPMVVPEPVPLPQHDFSFVLMFVGRLEPEKRIEDIFRAIAQIHRNYPSVGMMVVGEGREKTKLQLYARKLGIEKNILFLGNRDDAWGLMRNATAYIQASGYEGYSRTLLEAALARIPIITTDVGIVGEVFKGYEDVLPAAPGDPSSLVAHIRGLVEDNSIRKQLADNAERAARTHLENMHNTPKDIAEDLQKLL